MVDREDHHAWDLNGGVEVQDPTFQEEDHLVQMGKATLKIKIFNFFMHMSLVGILRYEGISYLKYLRSAHKEDPKNQDD